MDQSPIEEATRRFGGFHINPNYSREQFQRKKTISKSKIEEEKAPTHSPFGVFMRQLTNEYQNGSQNFENDSGVISSPFGDASPMANHHFNTRQSNVMRDCTGDTLNIIF